MVISRSEVRARPGLGSAHLSCRATWMLLDGVPSWRPVPNALNVRFGSKPDERGHRPGGPHLGLKQTKLGAKQTFPLEGLLSGVERT